MLDCAVATASAVVVAVVDVTRARRRRVTRPRAPCLWAAAADAGQRRRRRRAAVSTVSARCPDPAASGSRRNYRSSNPSKVTSQSSVCRQYVLYIQTFVWALCQYSLLMKNWCLLNLTSVKDGLMCALLLCRLRLLHAALLVLCLRLVHAAPVATSGAASPRRYLRAAAGRAEPRRQVQRRRKWPRGRRDLPAQRLRGGRRSVPAAGCR